MEPPSPEREQGWERAGRPKTREVTDFVQGRCFAVEGGGTVARRFDLDPHREISSILDHLN
jgi:hypothetical protein